MWVKRGILTSGPAQYLFGYFNTPSVATGYGIGFTDATDTLFYYDGTAKVTTAVYRDPAAWYHIVFSNNAGSFTTYVNGESVKTGTATAILSGSIMNIGRSDYNPALYPYYFDGEMAEINFVDGQALAPTAFGAYSTYNQWLPIRYAGTYGTNGFYLPFSATSATSYAGSFNGSTQYLTVPNNAAFTLGATATMEAWIYVTSISLNKRIITTGSNADSFDFGLYNSTNTVFVAGGNANTTTAIPLNTWMHVAAVFNSGALAIYFNGIAQPLSGVTTGYNLVASTLSSVFIGAQNVANFPGYISNLRVVKGTAVYTANFVPPTTNLTAITNTSLLTLQNATIVDNSTNAFTITNVGTVVTSVQSPFLNPTVLTADSSGNANNWTPNNISLTAGSTYDSLTDVPTLTSTTVANYAVLNPLDKGTGLTLSNANLTYATSGVATAYMVRATVQIPATGKYYWEATVVSGTPLLAGIATANANVSIYLGQDVYGWGYYTSDGKVYNNNATLATYSTATTGDVIGFAFSSDAQTFAIYKNNTIMGTLTGFTLSGTYFPAAGSLTSGGNFNFGQQPFTYTAPTGFLPLNTFNI